jgi:hypothetical protein
MKVFKVSRYLKDILYISIFIFLPTLSIADTVHWSAKVKWVTVFENRSSWIGIENPYAPNPTSSVWICGDNIVWLGAKDQPSPANMLSTALTLYANKNPVRIGIRIEGNVCEAIYLSARE